MATLVSPTSTTYTVTLSPSDSAVRFGWSGPGCGTTKETDSDDSSIFAWSHPEPPCAGGPVHADVTIRLEVASRGARVVCTYQGAQSGTGPACAGP